MVDSEGKGKDDVSGSDTKGSEHPEPTDPKILPEGIGDSGGVKPSVQSFEEKLWRIRDSLARKSVSLHSEKETEATDEIKFYIASERKEIDYESELKRIELQLKLLSVQGERERLAEKKLLGKRLFCLTVCWLTAVLATVVASGTKLSYSVNNETSSFWKTGLGLTLSDTIVVALICTTTANVLGLLYIVTNHLFPTSKPGEPKPDK